MKNFVKVLTALLLFVLLWAFFTRLTAPKYAEEFKEGSLTAEYYKDAPVHNVIFLGDCEVYEVFSPQVLWDDCGINSYVRGNAQQLVWQSYYMLEDTLKYEIPEAVVFNVLALKYDTPQREAYNRMTIDGMRWSEAKVKCIKASMLEDESFPDYVFTLLRYHSRITELTKEDFDFFFKRPQVSFNGYYMQAASKPVDTVPVGPKLTDYSFGDNALTYLDKIVSLCAQNDIQLVLVKAPVLFPYWYPEWDEFIEEYAAKHNVKYVNLLEKAGEIGIDYSTDTTDGGAHLNLYGAEKTTRYFGRWMENNLCLTKKNTDETLTKSWDKKREAYYMHREALIEGTAKP